MAMRQLIAGKLTERRVSVKAVPAVNWPMIVAAVSMALGVLLRAPVASYDGPMTQGDFNAYIFGYLGAYTDIASLYVRDQLWLRPIPYFDYALEYPVGIGALVWLMSVLTSDLMTYFLVTALASAAAGLLLLRLTHHFDEANPWLLALWPTLPLYVALNWDLLALLPTVVALLLFRRNRDGWGALALSVAVWIKFFPIVLVPLLLLDRAFQRRWRDVRLIAGIFGLVTLVVNLPVAIAVGSDGVRLRDTWLLFFRYNQERPPQHWSANLWNLFERFGLTFSAAQVNGYSALLLLAGIGAVAALVYLAHVGGRQGMDLLLPASLALIAWFLFINKVYSVQYSLWIAVLLVLIAGRSTLVMALAAAFAATDLSYAAATLTEFYFGWSRQDEAASTWLYSQAVLPTTFLRELAILGIIGWALVRLAPRTDEWRQQLPLLRARLAPLAAYVRPVLPAFLVHLLLVVVATAVAVTFFQQRTPIAALDFLPSPIDGLGSYVIQPLANWDGVWYSLIGEYGYWYDPAPHPAVTAFWPLYPLLLRVGHLLTGIGIPLLGVLFSNVTFLAALALLHRLVRHDYSGAAADRAVWLTALFPTAFYFSAVYTESLFLFLALGAFYAARMGRWGWAAAAGALAALTRNTGVLLLLPLGLLLVQQYGWHPRLWWRQAIPLLAIPLALLAYLGYIGLLWGNPLLPFEMQREPLWDRYQTWPWITLGEAVRMLDHTWFNLLMAQPTVQTMASFEFRQAFMDSKFYDLISTVAFLPLVAYSLWRLRPAYGLYALTSILVPLTSPSHFTPLFCMPRYLIILFPCFVVLALLVRNRWTFGAVLLLFAVQGVALLIQFSTWFFVS
jgi:Gpi18-like mannosyltransferase